MTTIFSSVTITGYNASPPADDGSTVAANRVNWSKHKTKLGDPLKSALETLVTNTSNAFGKIFHNATTFLSTATTIADSDRGKTFKTTGTWTLTLPSVAGVGGNYFVSVINSDGGTITITADGSDTINGAGGDITLATANKGVFLFCDGVDDWTLLEFGANSISDLDAISDNKLLGNISGGSAAPAEIDILKAGDATTADDTKFATWEFIRDYITSVFSGFYVEGTEQISTGTETEFDFTSIPSGTKRITISFYDIQLATDDILVQIGDSGGLETSGYTSISGQARNGTDGLVTDSTDGFHIECGGEADEAVGHMVLTRMNGDGDKWSSSHHLGINTTGTERATVGGGFKTLTAELDRIRIKASAANAFGAGSAVNVLYE